MGDHHQSARPCDGSHPLTGSAQPSAEIKRSFKKRIPGLDELRGVAIMLVLFNHGISMWLGFTSINLMGTLGVNIFFVISGYLICRILVSTRGNPGFFRTFYVRRIFRIWPLFLVITGMGFITGLYMNQPVWSALPYYITFTMNFLFAETRSMQSESGVGIPFTSPMWSLAIEEQFYIVLPLLVGWSKPRALPLIVTAICLTTALCSLGFLSQSGSSDTVWIYPNLKNTLFRIHYIGFGVLIAIRPRWAYCTVFGWLAASILVFNRTGMLEIIVAAILVWIIDHTIHEKPFFENRHLARAGFLCYGLYLIHWPLARIIEKGLIPHLGNSPWVLWPVFLLFLAVSYVAASLSFAWFENPIQKLRTRFEG